nr:MAG TPA: Diheme cytochrome c peroxidase [Bacteriophage sp.]
MPYYVKVTKKVREALLPAYLVVQRTFDGNYLLFQSALSKVEGNTLSERCAAVGGSLITPLEVAGEVNGTSCASCYTPKEYGGDEDEDTTEDFRPGENVEVPQPGENVEVPQPGENSESPKPEKNTETPTPSETEAEKKTESETDKKESEVTDEQK